MRKLQLLGRASSINVRKVRWTCDELGLEPEAVEWGTGALSLQSPDFLALNPNGLVPVLVDDGFVLWESNTICRYLAAREGRADLLPPAPAARARVEQWMDWQATELNTAWRHAFMGLVRQHPAFADAAGITASTASWNRHMALLDAALQRTGAFVTGDSFTLADVVLGLATQRWYATPIDRPPLAAVAAYYERLSARPGFMRHGRNGLP
jgi:glutathione S-transferase